MKLFDLLSLCTKDTPDLNQCKIHLAGWDGKKNPLNVYLEGGFDAWQAWQSKKNFERSFIIALISLPQPDKWLFVGIYRSNGYVEQDGQYVYRTSLINDFAKLNGRLVVSFRRSGRSSYLNAERWADEIKVSELKENKIAIAEFPGFSDTRIMKPLLDAIVKEGLSSWKSALSSVAGIYLITDTSNGKHYVGSACGIGGIWGRWVCYAKNGHGDNKDLKKTLKEMEENHAEYFQFTILEIADTHASEKDILARESYWKLALGSREFGYNKN